MPFPVSPAVCSWPHTCLEVPSAGPSPAAVQVPGSLHELVRHRTRKVVCPASVAKFPGIRVLPYSVTRRKKEECGLRVSDAGELDNVNMQESAGDGQTFLEVHSFPRKTSGRRIV